MPGLPGDGRTPSDVSPPTSAVHAAAAPLRTRAGDYFQDLQERITGALEAEDPGARFREDVWTRAGGGGGRTRVMVDAPLLEKGGVGFSAVHGELPDELAAQVPGQGRDFFATGVSLVLHPRSPRVPTVHANFRYVEKGDRAWFGGGSDLTPCYLVEDDAVHFHRTWKAVCDRHDPAYYPRFKKWCDEYFHLAHRGETRGVGGLFFDYLDGDLEARFAFVRDCGAAFLDAYLPIVRRRRDEPWGDAERRWQLTRRGRYVEFNLLYDRGTVFGLKTDGRVESILMSLPLQARWGYDEQPPPGSPEAALVDVLRQPREWVR
jgi:coproporphyrinogen III oxidase